VGESLFGSGSPAQEALEAPLAVLKPLEAPPGMLELTTPRAWQMEVPPAAAAEPVPGPVDESSRGRTAAARLQQGRQREQAQPDGAPEVDGRHPHAREWQGPAQQGRRRRPRPGNAVNQMDTAGQARVGYPVTENQTSPVEAWRPKTESESHKKQRGER
jgi:hypothetical protein